MKAMLVLENGTSFEGLSIGADADRISEVVLNTSVVGYQEMMTDPANAGKILVLTYPLIGNYGTAKKFNESKKCRLAGLVIKESSRIHSNWQAEGSFEDFLKKEDVVAISNVDTRSLAVAIRDGGEMFGIISSSGASKEELLKKLNGHKKVQPDFIKEISVKSPARIKGHLQGANIAVLDLGVTNSLIKQLGTAGCNITLLPYDTSSKDILAGKYDGILVSSGPESDLALDTVVGTIRDIIGKIPAMGIGSGHQVIARALGAKIKKMRIGHRGVNYPIRPKDGLKGDITVQNHSYVVDDDSLSTVKDVCVSARNVNDNSVEEMESKKLRLISAQYIPASPGFDEVNQAIIRFLKMCGKNPKTAPAAKISDEVQYAKA
jgi:carbamoyl-phosphate synthase small subunit